MGAASHGNGGTEGNAIQQPHRLVCTSEKELFQCQRESSRATVDAPGADLPPPDLHVILPRHQMMNSFSFHLRSFVVAAKGFPSPLMASWDTISAMHPAHDLFRQAQSMTLRSRGFGQRTQLYESFRPGVSSAQVM